MHLSSGTWHPRCWALALLLLAQASSPVRAEEAPETAQAYQLPAQALDLSLLRLAQQANLNLIGLSADMARKQAPALTGHYTLPEALQQLLADSGLRFSLDERGIVISPVPVATTSAPAPAPQVRERLLEEILVTSLRRSTELQKTPVAVTALSQLQLDQLHAKDIRGITPMVPGLEMTNTGEQSALLVQLRGIGQTNITEIADGPVAFHIDGIYLPRSQGATGLLHDIDQLEVLRGPQGTLFGRNATSGGINIQTRGAQLDSSSLELQLGLGNYQKRQLRLAANAPATDRWALRLATAWDSHAAYTQLAHDYQGLGPQYSAAGEPLSLYQQSGDVSATGPESEDQLSVRLSSLWAATDRLNWQLSLEHYRDRGTSVTELDPYLLARGQRLVVWDTPSALDMRNDTLRSRLQYEADGYQLNYLFGSARMERSQNFDQDMGRSGHFEQRRTDSSTFRFQSHELQWHNTNSETLQLVAGVFGSKEKNSIVYAIDHANDDGNGDPTQTTSFISDDPGAAVALFVQPNRQVQSLAGYAQGSLALTPATRATLGLRYTRDTKSDQGGRSLNCRVTAGFPYTEAGSIGTGAPSNEQIYADPDSQAAIDAGLPHDGGSPVGIGDQPCWVRQVNDYSATWSNTSGLIRLDYDWRPQLMLYGSLSSGFKSGHIQDRGNEAAPEEVVNAELGSKFTSADNTLRFNSALYRARYSNLQFSDRDQFDTDDDGIVDVITSTVVRNAAQATVDGLELELTWAPTPDQQLQLAATLMDARFDRFDIPDTLFGNRFNPWANRADAEPLSLVDLSGNRPVRAPEWKLSLLYERDFNFRWLRLTPRLLAVFSDAYYLDIYNRDALPANTYPGAPDGVDKLAVQEAYNLFDLSLRWEPQAGSWYVETYVKNLTDEQVKTSSGTFITPKGFDAVFFPPRTWGATFNVIF